MSAVAAAAHGRSGRRRSSVLWVVVRAASPWPAWRWVWRMSRLLAICTHVFGADVCGLGFGLGLHGFTASRPIHPPPPRTRHVVMVTTPVPVP
ncbi:hypothetical protein C8Q73DRAFT_115012 [Cubamyces lactineus]|nr:hypothetical protein C8Q73DRAFT_115012 [Cubamyces lactineus]